MATFSDAAKALDHAQGSAAAQQRLQHVQLRDAGECRRHLAPPTTPPQHSYFRPAVIEALGSDIMQLLVDLQRYWSQFGFMDQGSDAELVQRLAQAVLAHVRLLRARGLGPQLQAPACVGPAAEHQQQPASHLQLSGGPKVLQHLHIDA